MHQVVLFSGRWHVKFDVQFQKGLSSLKTKARGIDPALRESTCQWRWACSREQLCVPGCPFPDVTPNIPAGYGKSRLLYLHAGYSPALEPADVEHFTHHFQTFTRSSKEPEITVSEPSFLFFPQATDQMASSWAKREYKHRNFLKDKWFLLMEDNYQFW